MKSLFLAFVALLTATSVADASRTPTRAGVVRPASTARQPRSHRRVYVAGQRPAGDFKEIAVRVGPSGSYVVLAPNSGRGTRYIERTFDGVAGPLVPSRPAHAVFKLEGNRVYNPRADLDSATVARDYEIHDIPARPGDGRPAYAVLVPKRGTGDVLLRRTGAGLPTGFSVLRLE